MLRVQTAGDREAEVDSKPTRFWIKYACEYLLEDFAGEAAMVSRGETIQRHGTLDHGRATATPELVRLSYLVGDTKQIFAAVE